LTTRGNEKLDPDLRPLLSPIAGISAKSEG
jgi:hypothetical protein